MSLLMVAKCHAHKIKPQRLIRPQTYPDFIEAHDQNIGATATKKGINAHKLLGLTIEKEAADCAREVVVKTWSKPMSEELKQFWGVTGSTSEGSARVTSTHCVHELAAVTISGLKEGNVHCIVQPRAEQLPQLGS